MKVPSRMVRKTLVAMVASLGLAVAIPQSFADTASDNPSMMGGYGPGYGMGPGMMGGYGPGYGMGPGMMGGYGPGYGMGPGMMGGYGRGYGMGPGMMGGYGMGPGMMGGYGPGYGMGPGMMGGYGPGMMGGCGGYGYGAVKLTDAQREKIAKIQEDARRSQWEVMSKMRETMVQSWAEARKKIDAVLTKEQREQLRGG
jgi:Spy/CpxP family protein refolding chaperone